MNPLFFVAVIKCVFVWMHVNTMTTIRKCSAPMIIIGIIGLLED
jgi:hypothetical protein